MSVVVDLKPVDLLIKKYEGHDDALITMLQEIQGIYSYLPEAALEHLSNNIGISLSQIFSVATFYAQFYLTPRGRSTIRICRGTACHVRGGDRILDVVERELGIKEGETTSDLEYSLETVACIGACALAPTMVIGETTHGKMTPNKVADIFKERKGKEQEIE